MRNLPVDNDVRISQLVKRRAAEDKWRRRSQLQQSMVPPPSVEETLVDSSSPSPPSPTKPYSGPRSNHNKHSSMSSVEGQPYSPSSTSSSSTASTASPDASRSLSQRRNINNLVIETGDVSTAVNRRQRRIFSYIEGEAEVLATASDDRQHPFQNYYEFANTFRQQEGLGDMMQPLANTNATDLPDNDSTTKVYTTTGEDSMNTSSSTRPIENSTTSFTGTSSQSSNLIGLTPSNSTGSVIWVGKRNSRAAAAAAAAAATTTSSTAAEEDQPSYYEASVGVGVGGGNYELGEINNTTTTTAAPSTTYYQYNPTTTTAIATSPRLAPAPALGPAIPPRTTSHQQGSVSPIKDRFEQLHHLQQVEQQQKQSQPPRDVMKERSPVRVGPEKRDKGKDMKSPVANKKNNVSATVAMFNEGT